MFFILFLEILSNLFLYTIEIGQVAFVIAVIFLTIAIIIKIIKNRKIKKT